MANAVNESAIKKLKLLFTVVDRKLPICLKEWVRRAYSITDFV